MFLAFALELRSSAKHPKLHSSEVRRIPFDRTLHRPWAVPDLLTQLRVKVWGVQIAVSWSFPITRPNGQSGIVTCSAKISLCASTALISPAANRKLTGLAALVSQKIIHLSSHSLKSYFSWHVLCFGVSCCSFFLFVFLQTNKKSQKIHTHVRKTHFKKWSLLGGLFLRPCALFVSLHIPKKTTNFGK